MAKVALITGVTGQDGSLLAKFLIGKGYQVHGLIRRSSSTSSTWRVDEVYQDPHDERVRFRMHYGDMTDALGLCRLIDRIKPSEIYNLAAQSHVKVSFEMAVYTFDVVATGTLRLLEAVREIHPNARFYQASSSEMFGKVTTPTQNERTPFYPRSPYGVAKVAAHHALVNYREAYDMFACSGILFNHESEWRGETFVTRKVARAAARIAAGLQKRVYLGNLDARRDWGYAPEYVEAMWMMLQQPEPEDYVIATGQTHTVREMVEIAFAEVGLNWEDHVRKDENYLRPTEVDFLCGDSTKARTLLRWKPKTEFRELIQLMVRHEVQNLNQQQNKHQK